MVTITRRILYPNFSVFLGTRKQGKRQTIFKSFKLNLKKNIKMLFSGIYTLEHSPTSLGLCEWEVLDFFFILAPSGSFWFIPAHSGSFGLLFRLVLSFSSPDRRVLFSRWGLATIERWFLRHMIWLAACWLSNPTSLPFPIKKWTRVV